MYQALYRKWRPRTFDDVVGQEHITETLKQQVAGDRLSHAYLFTGTRGTGKTTCAKILARAVNCRQPENGNPCNQCPACLGIENGSILDVLELDAASNNGVDQVRALRDEAVYTPAAVRKRVYIVDEVHMLSTPAFNALLKILEEPPAHLMFILATTELHKVPATIRSRCQQFAFKRILPGQIAQRLGYVAQEEGIDLTADGAALLARLADGGLRDALSLLDQCSGGRAKVDEKEILDVLGLAGNLETAALMDQIARRDTAAALDTLARLYAGGKDVASVLGELSALARDLLLRKTAPQGGASLLTGGYDEGTMRALGEQFTAQRLLQMLTVLQSALADLPRSGNRRTDTELCLIRLCDESLDQSLAGLAARVARLEERLTQGGIPAQPPAQSQAVSRPVSRPAQAPQKRPAAVPNVQEDRPPWEEERPPLPEEPPAPGEMERVFDVPEAEPVPVRQPPRPAPRSAAQPAPRRTASAAASAAGPADGDRAFWPAFAAGLKGKIPPTVHPYLNNAQKVTGVWKNGSLTLWTDSEFTRAMLNKPAVLAGLKRAAADSFGVAPQVSVVCGTPPPEEPVSAPAQSAAPAEKQEEPPQKDAEDAMDALLAFGEQFDNVTIQ